MDGVADGAQDIGVVLTGQEAFGVDIQHVLKDANGFAGVSRGVKLTDADKCIACRDRVIGEDAACLGVR